MTADVLEFLNRHRLEAGADSGARGEWRHWRLSRDGDNLAWLVFDKEGASVNVLDEPVLQELDAVLAAVVRDPPRALVIRSAKASGFCAGADVGMFRGLTVPGEAEERLRKGHAIVDRLDGLGIPTIAVLHGNCLGGGLELALACHYRIAVEGAKLGFPEVLLGLHPGLGGTFRVMRVMAPIQAMTLMLTGRSLPAVLARGQGLVDTVVAERHVAAAVSAAASGKLPRRKRPFHSRLLELKQVRPLVARRLMAETEKKVSRKHYPAPFNLIELWRQHGGDRRAQQNAEIQSFSRLVASTSGQNLVRVFFLREALARAGKGGDSGIRHVHVVGAGTMGGDIAAWCAFQGFRVTLADMAPEMIARAVKRAAELCRRKHRSRAETRDVLDRLIPDHHGYGVPHADLVIEAVPEKLDIKRALYRELEARMKPGAILATNTSSIPLEDLRGEVADPGRFLGLHFFNPVASMELVEVVGHDGLRQDIGERANRFVGAIGRLPVPVRSAPGFLVNRVLTPYLLEAILLLDEAHGPEVVDQAARDFGMPMGPVELADQVGLDICVAVADMLRDRLDGAMPPVPRWVRDKVERGETGRKAGQGFYTWDNSGPRRKSAGDVPAGMADRLLLPLLNACVACLREGIVESDQILDGAVIFGTGFAPFRGGPIHYARQRGVESILAELAKLEASHGGRFAADAGWQALESR